MTAENPTEILATLGVEGDASDDPEARFEQRVRAAMVDARRDGLDYWQTFELLERYQRAAVRAAFRSGEFGGSYGDADDGTVQYSQVVHATARARAEGASERQLLVNLASAYGLFDDEWSDDREATRDEAEILDDDEEASPVATHVARKE